MTTLRPIYVAILSTVLPLSACASEPPYSAEGLPNYTPTYVERGDAINVAPDTVRVQQTTTIRRPNGIISNGTITRSSPVARYPNTRYSNTRYPSNSHPITQPSMVSRPSTIYGDTGYNSFEAWKQDFILRAASSGYNTYNLDRLLSSARLNSKVISLDGNQAEFAKMPWEYADSAVSSARVTNGKRKFASHRDLLRRLESQYGVDSEIITAIWGMESAYGAVTGNSYLPSSLGSLAYEGRRQEFAERQLLSLMQLLERGDVSWAQLDGSWAGGMGQTQFIPATWLVQGVDGDGDGTRNPWSTADALSSTANYLSNSGWIAGLPTFYEVQLPQSFNYAYVNTKQSASTWQALGLRTLDGTYLDSRAQFELWLPAGKDGPALLLSPNFDVIKVYNNSSSYALGVSLLGRAINNQTGIQTSWPRYERPLSRVQVTTLQQRLTNAGYDTNGVDGVIGTNTRKAFANWQAANGQVPDGFITQRSAQDLIW